MKEIMEQYAATMIAVLISVAILTGLFAGNSIRLTGMQESISAVMEDAAGKYETFDSPVFDAYMSDEPPRIVFYNPYAIIAGRITDVSSCFQAWNRDGTALKVEVLDIWKEDGEPLPQLEETKDFFCIEQEGRYWIMVEAEAPDGHKATMMSACFASKE